MDENGQKKVAILMRKCPYGLMYGFEGLRAIMGISIFEMHVIPVLIDDGVYVAMARQDPSEIDMNPLGDSFENLDDFGVPEVFVHRESMEKRGLVEDDIVPGLTIVDTNQVHRLLDDADLILPF